MRNQTKDPQRAPGVRNPGRSPLRLTALLYLREALLAEKYEECQEIIALAYEFGATESDVDGLLEDPRRQPGR